MKSQSYLSVTVQLCCLHLSSFLTLKHPRGFDYTSLLRLLQTVIAGNIMKFTMSSQNLILSLLANFNSSDLSSIIYELLLLLIELNSY